MDYKKSEDFIEMKSSLFSIDGFRSGEAVNMHINICFFGYNPIGCETIISVKEG